MPSAKGMGWLKDQPDCRDFSLAHPRITNLLNQMNNPGVVIEDTPGVKFVDLRKYCSPVEDQGQLGSCTAHAAIGALECMNKFIHGTTLDLSRRFVYKVTRRLAGLQGDSGAYLRNVAGALAYFGAPPEKYWPYDVANFDQEPDAFVYTLADNYLVESYARLDAGPTSPERVLESLRLMLTRGVPVIFGFTVYESINICTNSGEIPYPKPQERVLGGHAIMAVGYNDTTEKLLIRNSWGTNWGIKGYGWMPYDYVLKGLAKDFWVLLSSKFTPLQRF